MIPLNSLRVLVLLLSSCASEMEPFISGGSYVTIEEFPHSVYVYMVCKAPQACGGSVLTQKVILTAAHCFEDCLRKHDIIAYAGSEHIEKMTVGDRIRNFYQHEHYNMRKITNDIALGSVMSYLPLGQTVKRVMIASNFPGVRMARVAGWGIVNDETQQPTATLKMVVQIIQSEVSCRTIALQYIDGMMCAKNDINDHPSRGDSGSALISGTGQQIGLVSFRSLQKRAMVIYTNVSHYYYWINKNARDLTCSGKK